MCNKKTLNTRYHDSVWYYVSSVRFWGANLFYVGKSHRLFRLQKRNNDFTLRQIPRKRRFCSLEHIGGKLCFIRKCFIWDSNFSKSLDAIIAILNSFIGTLLSPWVSLSLWVSSFTSSTSCLFLSLESINNWAKFTCENGKDRKAKRKRKLWPARNWKVK